MRRIVAAGVAATLTLGASGVGPASALPGVGTAKNSKVRVVTDRAGDASSWLDIRRVRLSAHPRMVRVAVKLSEVVPVGSERQTEVGVHFDTKGDKKPEHLMSIRGFHYMNGSTTTWNKLRPNGVDPYGDWVDCWPQGWTYDQTISLKPKKGLVIFRAPRSCLGDPKRVRVSVQTYSGYNIGKGDWAVKKRFYTKRVRLR